MKKIIQSLKEFWKSAYRWPMVIVVVVVFIIGLLLGGGGGGPESGDTHAGHEHVSEAPAAAKVRAWTCSMHPQIQQPKPGKCPLCFMDLVPVEGDSQEELGPRQLKLSARALELAEIQTAPVERRSASTTVRMVGKIEYDETGMGHITARVPGRIDRLYVDFTGVQVRKGQRLADLYSPRLITAQQELLQALAAARQSDSGRSNLAAVREKLQLWGLTKKQTREIEKRGKAARHLTIYSPMGGVVVRKNVLEGMYIETGSPIYTIADLSRVWVKLDAYESDLKWIRFGQAVEFETEAYPGEVFAGEIAFIDPVLNSVTRTVKVRVNADNPGFKLKPGMFVRAKVRSELAVAGKVREAEAEPAGKEAPLVIPASAPLITGKRAVVYVAAPGKERVFEGRDIVLGPRAGNYYLVKEGLKEGEKVVVNGAFKIDSDLQIQAKPSMMSPPRVVPPAFQKSIDTLAAAYFDIQQALAGDNLEEAKKNSGNLLKKLEAVNMKFLTGKSHMDWMKQEKKIKESSQKLNNANDIEAVRGQFEALTKPMTAALKSFGSAKTPVYRFHCPMAFDNKGAYWLQNNKETRNPYFGASMLLCKDSVEKL